MSDLTYSPVRNQPVANFRYKGSHAKPVRRQVILTDITRKHFTGYEVREGNVTRDMTDSEIKTFDRSKIVTGSLTRVSFNESGIEA